MGENHNAPDQELPAADNGEAVFDRHPALRDFAAKLANVPDCEFLKAYCLEANAMFEFDHFCVGRMNVYSNMMRTVCFASEGKIVDNMVYGLSDTPCARVMDNHTCVYPKKVADEFPRDEMLQTMGIEAYVGAPVMAADGKPLGIITGLSKKPIENVSLALAVIEHFRKRVAFQLEASETLERYVMAFSGAEEGFWDWDLKTGAMVVSESVGKMLGHAPERGPRDLSALENLVHAQDREKFVSAVRRQLKAGEHFSLIVRFQHGDGDYRWVRASGRSVVDDAGRICRMIGSLINVDKWMSDGTLARAEFADLTGAAESNVETVQ